MKKKSKKYQKPRHPWNWQNLAKEKSLRQDYGLKNKKEIWKAESRVRKYRKIARQIIGEEETETQEKREKFLKKLRKQGLIRKNGQIDDILSMTTKDYLERRLQTLAWRKGYGKTPKQARQLITHGHIKVNGRKTTKPGMIISKKDEDTIDWYKQPIEHAESDKKPKKETRKQTTTEQQRKKPEKPEETKEVEKTKEKETESESEYQKIVKENIPEVKKKAKKFTEEEYKELLEAEQENKDRKTLKNWIEKQIEKQGE